MALYQTVPKANMSSLKKTFSVMLLYVVLQRECHTAGLCLVLSSCSLMCTPAAEEEDYDVMYLYSIDGIHRTFNVWFASNL
jgi:hypothetical protein